MRDKSAHDNLGHIRRSTIPKTTTVSYIGPQIGRHAGREGLELGSPTTSKILAPTGRRKKEVNQPLTAMLSVR